MLNTWAFQILNILKMYFSGEKTYFLYENEAIIHLNLSIQPFCSFQSFIVIAIASLTSLLSIFHFWRGEGGVDNLIFLRIIQHFLLFPKHQMPKKKTKA